MITESDLTDELRRLNNDLQPARQDGEFTISEYAQANSMTRDKARPILENGVRDGKLTKPPKRYIDGRPQVVYKKVTS